MRREYNLTQEELRKYFDYNPETGEVILINKTSIFSNQKIGTVVGKKKPDGYLSTRVLNKTIPLHRLIWIWYYGYNPEGLVDHINRDRGDNRISNLRETSFQCNIRNSKIFSTNKTSVKGVRYFKRDKKWRAYIKIFGKSIWLGDYSCFVEAVAHRLAAEECVNWSGCDVDSSSKIYMKKYLEQYENIFS